MTVRRRTSSKLVESVESCTCLTTVRRRTSLKFVETSNMSTVARLRHFPAHRFDSMLSLRLLHFFDMFLMSLCLDIETGRSL